jgi:Flp pilus assembly protein TadD
MNGDTGQGVAIMANSDNGIRVATEYVRSLAKEYNWKNMPEARSVGAQLVFIANLKGPDVVLNRYEELKASGEKRPEEFLLNMLGYTFLSEGKADAAIKMFQRNAQEYPKSSNVYDSLGEAYAAAGQKALANENYEKSLKLDPKNTNAVERLKKLKDEK